MNGPPPVRDAPPADFAWGSFRDDDGCAPFDGAAEHDEEIQAEPPRDAPLMVEPEHDPAYPLAPFGLGSERQVGDRLLSLLAAQGPRPVCDEGAWWRYEAPVGLWLRVEPSRLSQIVQSMEGAPVGQKRVPLKVSSRLVGGAIKLAEAQVEHLGFFADAPRALVAFSNGVATVDGGAVHLRPHAPGHRARVGYPFPYEPRQPKRFLQYLAEVFRGDEDSTEKIALVQEFFGLAILGLGTEFQQVLVATGPGGNGKGVLLEIVNGAMPPGSTCALSIHDFGDRFKPVLLVGKLLNACGELSPAEVETSEAFKTIVVGEPWTVQQKNQPAFTTCFVASHFFECNGLPLTRDHSDGFWRRFEVLGFNRKFTEAEKIRDLGKQILDAERGALVSWFLDGAARAKARNSYTKVPSSEARIAEWKQSADQVLQFLEDETSDVASTPIAAWARASDIYARYQVWARDNGHQVMNSTTFGARLGRHRTRGHTEKGNHYRVKLGKSDEVMKGMKGTEGPHPSGHSRAIS